MVGRNGTLRSADCTGTLRSLYEELLTPLLPRLTMSRLIIIPDGLLHLLPFHALFDGKDYLGDRYEILYAPSASVFKQNMDRPPVQSEKQVLAEKNTSRTEFFSEAAEAHSLHIETEIVYRPHRPLFSCFKIGDEWVTALDLFSTFAECNIANVLGRVSGVEPARSGEDFQALARAFLYAGARSVLLGLWTTPPESSNLLVRYFHEQWRSGQSKPEALRNAIQRLRKEFIHPFHWAPFVLFGQY
jgi:CHAT domain-containing protein